MNRFVVIDLETTGNNPNMDGITQVGAVLIEAGKIVDTYSSFVYTDQEIPQYIANLTGINNEMLIGAPSIDDVLFKLIPLLENSIFVAHNAAFDLAFIQRALDDAGYLPFSGIVIDTLDFARILLPTAESYKLTQITEEMEIIHDNPHRADEDSLATANLLILLINQLKEMPLIYLQRLSEVIKYTHRDLLFLIEDAIADKYASNKLDEEDYIVFNQLALQPVEEQQVNGEKAAYNQGGLESIFDEAGLLFEHFPEFELRPAQRQMAKEVWNAFANYIHLMVEAGTGTGKSLAYLIPAIYWSKENDEKIVIATHTINLQEQLYQRDIPLLKQSLPFDFTATILKGRNNYLCLRKFDLLLNQYNNSEINKENAVDAAQLLTWVTLTATGDVEEINLSMTGRNLWNQIRSDADSCLNRYCPWFRTCFYHRARNKAQTADIIITNHSLILTNLKADHRILPAYKRLIIDEAHQFEEVALKHLGLEINQYQVNSLLARFYKDAKNGFLITVINILQQSQDPDQIIVANQIQTNVLPIIPRLEGNINIYFNLLGELIDRLVKNQDSGRKVIRIIPKLKERKEWEELLAIAEGINIDLAEWLNEMDDIYKRLKGFELEENLLADFNGNYKDLLDFKFGFSEWNNANDKNRVYWVETLVKGKRYSSYLFAAPIEIGPYIKNDLIDKLDSIIMTSATLSVNDSFDYISKEFGFEKDDEQLRTVKLTSPFDYKEQAVVYIPNDAPNIQDVSEDEYVDYLAKSIADIAITLNGKTLVLFTSHQMLKKTYNMLKEILEPLQIKVLGHGIDSSSRSKLTKRFADNSQTVLLGTNSFWEGVDVPGEALSALIIVRLPFTPPNNPIHEAKTEKLKEQQRNSFMELSVPQAVIRFKQGFGRLIRTRRDRGIFVIFDRRVVETRYGKAFIKSLPVMKMKYQSTAEMEKDIEEWLIK